MDSTEHLATNLGRFIVGINRFVSKGNQIKVRSLSDSQDLGTIIDRARTHLALAKTQCDALKKSA